MLTLLVGGAIWAWRQDDRDWNGGACHECGDWWESFDMDSQGGRGYRCGCGRSIWISYPVDRCHLRTSREAPRNTTTAGAVRRAGGQVSTLLTED